MTLVRRGYRTPEQARAFLAADESHPPSAFRRWRVVEQVREAVAAGRRITVHGDFDVDGVCATTIMVATLRELGAECDWLIPDRIGRRLRAVRGQYRRLAERGTGLLITVDCGITFGRGGGAGAGAGDRGRSSPITISKQRSCRTARSCTRRSAATRSSPFAGPPWLGSSAAPFEDRECRGGLGLGGPCHGC